jgi:ligand-binding sensor domain-containing protein
MLLLQRFFIIFTACVLISIKQLHAQRLKFEQLDIRQGLPSTEVYNLYQDKKGYVWAFTEYGIVKHNGVKFIPVCENIPLSESAVYSVTENSKGEMYMANSKAAIYKIRNDSAFLVTGMEETSRKIISNNQVMLNMIVDDSSNIYFSTFSNSYKFSPEKKIIYDLTAHYQNRFSGTCYKKVGGSYAMIKLPVGTANQQITILDEQDKILQQFPFESLRWERNYIRRQKDGLYILMTHFLFFISNSGEIKKATFDKSTINFEISPDGRIWIGILGAGLYELNHDLAVVNHHLDKVTVSDMLFDDQFGLWVSTIENAVYYCKNIHDMYYENIQELYNITMLKKANNRLFAGTAKGDLFVKDTQVRKIYSNTIESPLTDIIYVQDHYLVGDKNGMRGIDSSLKIVTKFSTAPVNMKSDLGCYQFEEPEHDTVTFLSGSSLLTYLDKKVLGYRPLIYKTRSICRRKRNEFLVGTHLGLFVFDTALHCPRELQELQNINISRLKKDSRQNIWVCTRGRGLYQLTPENTLIRYSNVPSEVINDISFVRNNMVLLSTNKGLFINFNGKLNSKPDWILLLDNEALAAEEYSNDIYIATKQSLVSLSGKYLLKNDNSKFYLESVVADGKKIAADNIDLDHRQNDLYFNFDLLAYQFPDKKLVYQLIGNSASQGVVSGTQLHLQNLSPGEYYLVVHPLVNISSKKMIRVHFFIRPAFWQTTAFLAILVISFLALLVSIAIFVVSRIKKKEERKAYMTNITVLLSEYRLTALKAQINPHFISNSLAAIQQLILNNEIDSANQYIAKFSLLIRYVLKYSDKSAVRLKHEIEIIDLNVELEQLRFGYKFLFEKEIAGDIATADLYIPPLITQPFIENAVWHGLLPLKNQRTPKLILRIDIRDEKLIISIIDNGVGRHYKQRDPEGGEREHKGVWIIKSRMETLNNLYSGTDARIVFSDLYDDKKEAAGTRVDIIFPLSMLDKLYDDKNKERYY